MLLVDRAAVGTAAFARLQRDGLIHEVVGPRALPLDIPSTRGTRWAVVETFVPRDAWLTGLAALWIEGICAPPWSLDIAGPRGRHTTAATETAPTLVMHSGSAGIPPVGARGPRTTGVTRACLDALMHSPAVDALPAVASALRTGSTTCARLADTLMLVDRHTHGHARVGALVGALAEI